MKGKGKALEGKITKYPVAASGIQTRRTPLPTEMSQVQVSMDAQTTT